MLSEARSRRQAVVALLALIAVTLMVLAAPSPAAAAPGQSIKKGIWDSQSRDDFATMRRLGAGVYSARLHWNLVAPTRPANPRNPRDPAYQWNAATTAAIRKARRYGMKVALEVHYAPGWANGGRPPEWVPTRVADYADFVTAASRRYPRVRYWVVWAEPTRKASMMPLITQKNSWTRLDAAGRRAPHYYARLLDRAYGALKRVDRKDKVIGGNSFNGGDVSPFNWIRDLKLPNGRPPRMDMYGHHPFSVRRPNLANGPFYPGVADFSDLDTLAGWVDRYLGDGPSGKPLRLWLGEVCFPTDHANDSFNVWVTRSVQARWIRSALKITRSWKRIAALIWFGLYDPPPVPSGRETRCGLLDAGGEPKPGYLAFRNG